MDLTKETVAQLARLSRIECSEEEQEALLADLKKIVAYVEGLQSVDTDAVRPCDHVIASMVNVTRPDEVGQTLDRKTFLDNAPDHVGGMVRVPPVIRSTS